MRALTDAGFVVIPSEDTTIEIGVRTCSSMNQGCPKTTIRYEMKNGCACDCVFHTNLHAQKNPGSINVDHIVPLSEIFKVRLSLAKLQQSLI